MNKPNGQGELAVQHEIPPMMAPVTPMELLASAVKQGASIDTIERLAKLQREMMEYDAKVAFADAMTRVQGSLTRIRADLNNPQTKSRYASYAALDRAVRPIATREGFALSFDTGECPVPDHMRVLCHVSHSSGHERTYQMDVPADGKGAKGGDVMTKTHAAGAAASYGMRYLLKMIFNLAVGEDDADGNQPGEGMSESEFAAGLEGIEGADSVVKLENMFKLAYRKAREAKDDGAMRSFVTAKDKRKVELS